MRKALILLAGIWAAALLLAGCAQTSAPSGSTGTTSPAASATAQEPDQTPDNGKDPSYVTMAKGWVYYLDLNVPVNVNDYLQYHIHKKKADGTGDVNLKIACKKFNIAGEYLYADVDTNGENGLVHWKTYRYDLNGENKKELAYTDMNRLAAGGRLYFTCYNDLTVYNADFACEDVKPIKVEIPDAARIRERLKNAPVQMSMLTVRGVKDGWMLLTYEVADNTPALIYQGHYRVNLGDNKVEKMDDGYFPVGDL